MFLLLNSTCEKCTCFLNLANRKRQWQQDSSRNSHEQCYLVIGLGNWLHFRVMQWKRIYIRHLILNFQFFIEFPKSPANFYSLFSLPSCLLKSQGIIEMNHTTPTYHFVSFFALFVEWLKPLKSIENLW